MIEKTIKLAHKISLLISETIIKNKDLNDLQSVFKEIENHEDIFCLSPEKNFKSKEFGGLFGESFSLISPRLYSYYHNYNNKRHIVVEDFLCFYVKIKEDIFRMLFEKETGVIISIKSFKIASYESINEIQFISYKNNKIEIKAIPSSFGFIGDYKLNDFVMYSKLKEF